MCQLSCHMIDKGRLISLPSHRHWCHIRAISFHHNSLQRKLLHNFWQFGGIFEGQWPIYPNKPAHFHQFLRNFQTAREAMHYAYDAFALLAENFHGVPMSLTIVDTYWQMKLTSQIQLTNKKLPLQLSFVPILFPIIIQANFPNGYHLGQGPPASQLVFISLSHRMGFLWMNPYTSINHKICLGKSHRALGGLHRVPHIHNMAQASLSCPLHNCISILSKMLYINVSMGIYQMGLT